MTLTLTLTIDQSKKLEWNNYILILINRQIFCWIKILKLTCLSTAIWMPLFWAMNPRWYRKLQCEVFCDFCEKYYIVLRCKEVSTLHCNEKRVWPRWHFLERTERRPNSDIKRFVTVPTLIFFAYLFYYVLTTSILYVLQRETFSINIDLIICTVSLLLLFRK